MNSMANIGPKSAGTLIELYDLPSRTAQLFGPQTRAGAHCTRKAAPAELGQKGPYSRRQFEMMAEQARELASARFQPSI